MSYEKLEDVRVQTFDVQGQLPAYVDAAARDAAERGERERAAIVDPDMLEARQRYIRESLERSLGGFPSSDSPLRPAITGERRGDGFRVENVIFESRPLVYVTGNFYVPDGLAGAAGAVLLLCGHREQAKHCEEYQTVCQTIVRSGLVVFAIDPPGQGERFGYYDPVSGTAPVAGVSEHERVGRQCLAAGDNLARYMLHDAMRAIDYMHTRREVDPGRIGVTGHSGGGTQTSLVMMADPRIACAAPGGFIMNRTYFRMTGKTQDAEQKWPGFSAMGLDHEDIVLAMAPRPVLVLATTYDSVPIEAPRRNVESNRRFWDMYGRGDRLSLFEDRDVHRFTVPLAKAAAAFFADRLSGLSAPPADRPIVPFAPERLWCTKSGQVIGELEGARTVLDENKARICAFAQASARMPEADRRLRAVEWLRERVYHRRLPHPPNPRHYAAGEVGTLQVRRSLWWSQTGLLNMGYQFRDRRLEGRTLPVTIAVWDGGVHALAAHAQWIETVCAAGRLVLVLNPTGVGPLVPYRTDPQDDPLKPFDVIDKHTDELMLLGDSMAALRTFDVLRAVEMAAGLDAVDGSEIELYGHGRYAVYAGWAAMLEPRLRKVRMEERMPSLEEWAGRREYDMTDSQSFIIPGMLRYFDLPDMDGWLSEEGRLDIERDPDDEGGFR